MLKPVPHLLNVTIRDVPASHIFVWLQKGFFDAFHSSWLSLAHGVVLAAFGALLFYFAGNQFWLLAGAFSGFMVMSPILATSLYAMSRDIELGRTVSIQTRFLVFFRLFLVKYFLFYFEKNRGKHEGGNTYPKIQMFVFH